MISLTKTETQMKPKKMLLQPRHSVPTGVRIAEKNLKSKADEGKEVAPLPAQDHHHHLIHQGHLQALTDQLAEEGEGGGGEGLTQAQVASARDPVGPVVV